MQDTLQPASVRQSFSTVSMWLFVVSLLFLLILEFAGSLSLYLDIKSQSVSLDQTVTLSTQVESELEGMLNELLLLSNESEAAAAIIGKYQIKRSSPFIQRNMEPTQ